MHYYMHLSAIISPSSKLQKSCHPFFIASPRSICVCPHRFIVCIFLEDYFTYKWGKIGKIWKDSRMHAFKPACGSSHECIFYLSAKILCDVKNIKRKKCSRIHICRQIRGRPRLDKELPLLGSNILQNWLSHEVGIGIFPWNR